MDSKQLGNKIRILAKINGVTHQQLLDCLNKYSRGKIVTEDMMKKWLDGDALPNYEQMRSVALLLKCSVADLLS